MAVQYYVGDPVIDQLNRCRRWLDRMQQMVGDGNAPSPEAFDYALVVLLYCWSMRDWLLNSGFCTKEEATRLFASGELRLARDVANRQKHLEIQRPSVDANHQIVRSYVWADPPGHEFVLLAGGNRTELLTLCRRAVEQLESFVQDRKA